VQVAGRVEVATIYPSNRGNGGIAAITCAAPGDRGLGSE